MCFVCVVLFCCTFVCCVVLWCGFRCRFAVVEVAVPSQGSAHYRMFVVHHFRSGSAHLFDFACQQHQLLLRGLSLPSAVLCRLICVVAQTSFCVFLLWQSQVGSAAVWNRVSPKILFPNGFFATTDCSFDAITSLDLSNMGLTALPSGMCCVLEKGFVFSCWRFL